MSSHEATILEIINTLTPILCRPGGKKFLKKRIISEMAPHKIYVEPFLGTGGVFFTKPLAEKNILGDNDRELMDFYKKIQKTGKLKCNFDGGKSKWNQINKKKNKTTCDYAFIIKKSFGCAGTNPAPKVTRNTKGTQSYDKQVDKLKKAKLITGDFKKTIKQNDSKDTLFYLDPPYHETSCSYPDGSCDVDPYDVKKAVDGIKGNFILSYNNHPEVRKIFCKDYKCKTVQTRYTANALGYPDKQNRKELLIKNF